MARIDPHSATDPEQGRISSLHLHLDVDFECRQLRGEARLTLAEPARGRIDLDTRGLQIEAVTDERGKDLPWALGQEEPVVGTPLQVERPEPTANLRIRYATSVEASALQWLRPAQTAGGEHPYLFSQCQPIHARSMVPIQDSPSVRFSYQAAITVPESLTAVMSAAPGQSVAGSTPGTRIFRFEMPQPIPAYLLAIAVGNLAKQDLGPRSRVYTEPEMLGAAAWEFAEVDSLLRAAESLFGPYPWTVSTSW